MLHLQCQLFLFRAYARVCSNTGAFLIPVPKAVNLSLTDLIHLSCSVAQNWKNHANVCCIWASSTILSERVNSLGHSLRDRIMSDMYCVWYLVHELRSETRI